VESALPTKVAQADYDVAIASATAAIAQAASDAAGAQSSANTAQATADAAATAAADAATAVAAKEDKGFRAGLEIYDLVLDTLGAENMQNGVPWTRILEKSAEGKLVRVITVQPQEIVLSNVTATPTPGSGIFARFVVECPGGLKLADGATEIAIFGEHEAYMMKEVAGAWAFIAGA
jgi:hypothetical protein